MVIFFIFFLGGGGGMTLRNNIRLAVLLPAEVRCDEGAIQGAGVLSPVLHGSSLYPLCIVVTGFAKGFSGE